jgi:MarC family membrane protein
MTIYTAALALILVLDPLGNIPVFMSILKNVEPKRRNFILLRETFIAFLILSVFLFFGQYILQSLNLSQASIGVAGGLILFIIAIRMIFPPETTTTERQMGEPFIVPLAIPLTAGPSAIATVLLFASKDPERLGASFLAVLIACVVFALILLSSRFLIKVLRTSGLVAMERLMGMLLTALAVQMFLSGIQAYFNLH